MEGSYTYYASLRSQLTKAIKNQEVLPGGGRLNSKRPERKGFRQKVIWEGKIDGIKHNDVYIFLEEEVAYS